MHYHVIATLPGGRRKSIVNKSTDRKRGHATKDVRSKIRDAGRAGERDHVADVLHAGDEEQDAFEA